MLDRELLESEGLPRLWEAVLVGRPTQALEIVDVVDDRNAAGDENRRFLSSLRTNSVAKRSASSENELWRRCVYSRSA